MRISDWSSDVCSSDLGKLRLDSCCGEGGAWLTCVPKTPQQHLGPEDFKQRVLARLGMPMLTRMPSVCKHGTREIFDECVEKLCASKGAPKSTVKRSEEHTSELQSLMRISYAVICLKKKKPQR